MEIWLKQDGTNFRFAVLPEEYEITTGMNNTTVNINQLGEINLLGKRNLKQISLAKFFPKEKYAFCQYSSFPTPKESVKIIENMENNGTCRLVMTGTDINMLCTIESFKWGENEATGDINFTIDIKEYRKPKVIRTIKKETAGTQIKAATINRMAKEVKSGEYVIKKGDTLSDIAKALTGSSANWKAIYEQNKSELGGNPNKIYPNQKLVINV